jgi:hypothetical protein
MSVMGNTNAAGSDRNRLAYCWADDQARKARVAPKQLAPDYLCPMPDEGPWVLVSDRGAFWTGQILSRTAITALPEVRAQHFRSRKAAQWIVDARPDELEPFRIMRAADVP